MLFLWMVVVELIELHLSGRKATVAAQTAADLIAQEKSMTSGQLDDIVAAVQEVMKPYPTSNMSFDFASVEADRNGNVSIGWVGGMLRGLLRREPIFQQGLYRWSHRMIALLLSKLHTLMNRHLASLNH